MHVDGVLELGSEGVVGDSNTILLIGLYLASLKTFAPYQMLSRLRVSSPRDTPPSDQT